MPHTSKEGWRFDSLTPSIGIFFEDELRATREEILEDSRPPLNGFATIPQANDIPEWANSYEHQMYEVIGVAEFISDYADDLPNVDIAGRSETFNARAFGCAYKFSNDEIAKSQALGKGIDRKRARAARVITEQKFNRIMFYGDPETLLWGLFNSPYVPRYVSSVPFDATSDSGDILAEMNAIWNTPFLTTETVSRPDFMGMYPEGYTYVSDTPWSASAGDTTILEHFRKSHPEARVEVVRENAGAGPNGEDLITVYPMDEDVFAHKMIRPFTQEAPQDKNLAQITNCHAKSGGIAADRPLEMVIAEIPRS